MNTRLTITVTHPDPSKLESFVPLIRDMDGVEKVSAMKPDSGVEILGRDNGISSKGVSYINIDPAQVEALQSGLLTFLPDAEFGTYGDSAPAPAPQIPTFDSMPASFAEIAQHLYGALADLAKALDFSYDGREERLMIRMNGDQAAAATQALKEAGLEEQDTGMRKVYYFNNEEVCISPYTIGGIG